MAFLAKRIRGHILEELEKAFNKAYGLELSSDTRIEHPPQISFGDFTVPCFQFVELLGKDPKIIASEISRHISKTDFIERVEAAGPYLNFKIFNSKIFSDVLTEAARLGERVGSFDFGKGERVMVEYLSPNTNKPLHLGHMRNGALGMAVSNLFLAGGFTVIKANLVNDRGVHICKSMLAYKKWGQGVTPQLLGVKGDHFVGDMYVLYSQKAEEDPSLEQEVYEMLRKWEEGDSETLDLWKEMNGWVYEGFERTYKELGLEFDIFYYESDTYKLGKDIVLQALSEDRLARLDNGTVVALMPIQEFGADKDGGPKKITLIRPDGTTVYITQDIGTAIRKFEEHKLDRSIYIVGSEQKYHFKSLFAILKMLGYTWAESCYHLSYGMVYLPEGKMKSREGKVVDADDLILSMKELAREEILKRVESDDALPEDVVEKRSHAIALGAIKFYLLRVGPNLDIHFDPKESVSFDGNTGPYCQYGYARSRSILRKSLEMFPGHTLPEADFSLLGNDEERELLKMIIKFPEAVRAAVNEMAPSILCSHVYEMVQAFNNFYQKHRVLSDEIDKGLTGARLELVKAFASCLKKGLTLLGIEPIEEM